MTVEEKSYCECTNENCQVTTLISIPDQPCPKCKTKLKIQEVEPW